MITGAALAALVLGTSLVKAGTDGHDAIRRHAELAKKQEESQGYMSVGYYVSLTPVPPSYLEINPGVIQY